MRFVRTLTAARKGREEVTIPPLDYFLEVTNRCNIRCRTCARLYDPAFLEKENVGDMTLDIFRKIEPWLKYSLKVNTVGFGEPFLNKHILEIMKSASKSKNYITVITNGTLFTEEMISRIVDLGLDVLVVSMDGGTESVFEDVRRGAKWKTVIKALGDFRDHKKKAKSILPGIIAEFVAMKCNFRTLPRLVEVISELGVEQLHVEPLIRGGNDSYQAFYAEQSLAHLSLEEVRKLFDETRAKAAAKKIKITGLFAKVGVDPIWQDSKIWSLGYVDSPEPLTPVENIEVLSGWCLHPSGILKVSLLRDGKEIAETRPCTARPDVAGSVSGDFPGKETCGFQLEVPISERGKSSPLELVAIDHKEGKTLLGKYMVKAGSKCGQAAQEASPPQPDDRHKEEASCSMCASTSTCTSPESEKETPPLDDKNSSPVSEKEASPANDKEASPANDKEASPAPETQSSEKAPPPRAWSVPYCTEPWTTCYVGFDGKVFPCCAAQGAPLGDLTKEDLPAIWNGKHYKKLRRKISAGKVPGLCRHCVSNQRTLTKSIWAQFLPVLFKFFRR